MPDNPLDLPAQMFRSGATVEETTIIMGRRNIGPVNVDVKFTELGGQAVFEGDIILGLAEIVRGVGDPGARGIGIVGDKYRWPNGVLPYVVEDALQVLVKAAISHWQERTPIQFVPRTDQADYLSFEPRDGCWSRVGRHGGTQVISLGPGCGLGAAIHEIGHALGLWHEQSRSDRDEHIEIVWANIDPQFSYNFDKHVQDATDLGQYDYASIMHYPATAFSVNGQPTIRTRQGQPIGQRDGLARGDIASIRMMYPDLDWSKVAP